MHFNRLTILVPIFIVLASATIFAVHFNWVSYGQNGLSFNILHALADDGGDDGGGSGGGDAGDDGGGSGDDGSSAGEDGGGCCGGSDGAGDEGDDGDGIGEDGSSVGEDGPGCCGGDTGGDTGGDNDSGSEAVVPVVTVTPPPPPPPPAVVVTPPPPPPPPLPPSSTSVSAVCSADGRQASLSWLASSGATNYQLALWTNDGYCPNSNWSKSLFSDGTWDGHSCHATNVSTAASFPTVPGHSYNLTAVFPISAAGTNWDNPPSTGDFVCAAPLPPPPAPLPPPTASIAAVCSADGRGVDISWSASPGATNYELNLWSTDSSCPAGWLHKLNPDGSWNGHSCYATNISTAASFLTVPGNSYNAWVFPGDSSNLFNENNPPITGSFVCTPPSPPPPPPPLGPSPLAPACVLTASPTAITPGGSSTLTWTTTNATFVSIDQGVGVVAANGSSAVSPTVNTTYTLTATGAGGSVTCPTSVTLTTTPPPPPVCTLTASPHEVSSGDTSTLTWTTSNASTFVIDHGIGGVTPVAGGSTTSPAITSNTTFTGTVTSATGVTATCADLVTIRTPNPTCSMSVSPTSIRRGDSATLSWGGSRIDDVSIDHGIGTKDVPGSTTVEPDDTGTFRYVGTFHATNGDTLTCDATLEVTSSGGGGGGGGGGHRNRTTAAITLLSHPVAAPLSYLYLSQMPYTGLDLGPVGTVLYWAALIAWSLALAYLLLFGVGPYLRRRLSEFSGNLTRAINESQPTLAMAAPSLRTSFAPSITPAVAAPARLASAPTLTAGYSAYEGFKSLAEDEKVLTIDDIVKGLSRPRPSETLAKEGPRSAVPMQHRQAVNVEPIYENVEPIYENVEPIREPVAAHPAPVARAQRPAAPEVPAETPAFIEAMLAGDRERAFSMLREVARSGGDPEAFFTQAACALDDAYRARLEGVPVHPEIARITQGVATPVLERLVTALTVAVDSSYSIGITGAKLALTRALATLGA